MIVTKTYVELADPPQRRPVGAAELRVPAARRQHIVEPRQEVRAPCGWDVVRRHREASAGQPGQEGDVLKGRRHLPARKVERVRLWPLAINQRRQ